MSAEKSPGRKQPEQKPDSGDYTPKVLDAIALFTGIESVKEIQNSALNVFGWILEQQALGRTVASLGSHEVSQVVSSHPPILGNFIVPEKRVEAREHYRKLINERGNQEKSR